VVRKRKKLTIMGRGWQQRKTREERREGREEEGVGGKPSMDVGNRKEGD
jgi:hypothetical protein